jgi:hypothetical protein
MLRNTSFFLFAFLLFATSCKKSSITSKTLTLQPQSNPTEMNLVIIGGQDESGTTGQDLPIEAWTNQSALEYVRVLIQFDLSSIPSNATIKSATLSLYSDTLLTNGNFIDANFGSNNSLWLEQVTSNWSTSTANWTNQPTASSTNPISIPSTSSTSLDITVDVTSMVASMVKSSANYGFFIKLQNEIAYTCRIFASSNSPYPAKHPKLVVDYQY